MRSDPGLSKTSLSLQFFKSSRVDAKKLERGKAFIEQKSLEFIFVSLVLCRRSETHEHAAGHPIIIASDPCNFLQWDSSQIMKHTCLTPWMKEHRFSAESGAMSKRRPHDSSVSHGVIG